MSRSLSRIRHLISEIEEIQRQGQQGAKVALDRSPVAKLETPEKEKEKVLVSSLPLPPLTQAKQPDPFDEIAPMVDLDTKRSSVPDSIPPGKIFVQLSGEVVLTLQIADSNETVELKQVGNRIEIRFADGKAFHIPFKAVA